MDLPPSPKRSLKRQNINLKMAEAGKRNHEESHKIKLKDSVNDLRSFADRNLVKSNSSNVFRIHSSQTIVQSNIHTENFQNCSSTKNLKNSMPPLVKIVYSAEPLKNAPISASQNLFFNIENCEEKEE